jgi:glycine/D-amino acid oxidase-like deaminating enzyme
LTANAPFDAGAATRIAADTAALDDRDTAIGEDPCGHPGFFRAAALGGSGVMTSPAVGALFLGPVRLGR